MYTIYLIEYKKVKIAMQILLTLKFENLECDVMFKTNKI